MAAHMAIPVPTVPPQPPQISLLNSAVRPDDATDPTLGTELELIPPEQQALLPDGLLAELRERQGEAWVRGITYAPESHAEAAIRDPCDLTTVALPALPAPTIKEGEAKAGGGTVPAEALEYFVTAINANGETVASSVFKITPGAEGKVVLTVFKIGSGGIKYRFYRAKGGTKKGLRIKSKAGGNSENPFTPIGEGTTFTWTDIGEAEEAGKESPASNGTAGPGSYSNLPLITAIPYLVEVNDQCSTFAFEARDFKGRALRLLENATPQAMGREFWTGKQAIKSGWPNPYLAREVGLTELEKGKKPSPTRGLQILQDALQQYGFGGQGMIHCQAQTATNLTKVRRVGTMMLDMFDNIVVPDPGYPGTGPDKGEGAGGKEPAAGCAYMFASTLVMARVEKEGTVFPDTFAEATDWGQGGFPDTIRFKAEKFAIAYSDDSFRACVEVKLEE